jgi:hypothetical protein
VAQIVVHIANATVEVIRETVVSLLEFGATLGQLVADSIRHPDQFLRNMLTAFEELGHTLDDIVASVAETGEELIGNIVTAFADLGRAVRDILGAVLRVAAAALTVAVVALLQTLISFRPLAAEERADARTVFGDSVDLDRVFITTESFQNDIIFGIQDFFTENPDSRAFVTMNVINFDVDDTDTIALANGLRSLQRPTFIHEMTHIWQAQNTGAFYLTEAIHGQVTDGYNYGYDESLPFISVPVDHNGGTDSLNEGFITGEGAVPELAAANGNLEQFNPEQQGQIIMHYFVRRFLLGRPANDWAPWQPYVDAVRDVA